jgi:hypothetical protein
MKYRLVFVAGALTLLFLGCEENPVEQYGTGLVDAYKKAEPAADEANLAMLQQSIQAFRAAKGRFPENLEELQGMTGTSIDPEQYLYDPGTGQLSRK